MTFHARLDALVVRYAKWVLAHKPLVIGISMAVTILCMAGLHNFLLNNDYVVYFQQDNPLLHAYEQTQQEYATDDTVFFVVTANNGDVFEHRVLAAIDYLSEEAWQLPYAARVDSLTTYQHAWSEGDDLLVNALVEQPATMTSKDLATARDIAYAEPMLQNRLIKEESPVTGVNVTINIPDDVPRASIGITKAAEALMADVAERYPEVSIRLTGLVPLNNAFLVASLNDLFRLVPLMVLIILITMMLLLKSFWLMVATVLIVILSAFSAVGVLSWLDYEVSGPVTVLPLIVLTLAVANCIHILISMQTAMRSGMSKTPAIVESIRVNMLPVFITSLTTAIGFLCMTITPVPPLRVLGCFTAFGVLVAFWLAVFLLPALVACLPFTVSAKSSDARMRSFMESFGEFVLANKGVLAVSLTALALLIAMNISSLRINNQFVEWFDNDYPIRQDTEYAMNHLTGIYQLVFDIPAGDSGDVNEPTYLTHVDDFTTWLESHKDIVHVSGITSTMKRLNSAMHGDDPAMYRIPESREMAAQYLLLYEMSLPMGMALNTEVNMDKSASRLVATTRNLRSEDITVLANEAEAWQREHWPPAMFAPALGPSVMFAEVARTMMESMMISAPLALLLVSIALMFALRSIRYGLLSIVPNVLPLAVGFGIWGLMGRDMNFSMTTIVAMSVGIVVDDTVHFLSKYLRARREHGLSPEDGIRYAFRSVGKAMWVTSFVLVAGFSIMMLSPMAYCDNMGLLTSIIIIAALIGDFMLLPAILLYTDGQREVAYTTLKEVKHEEKTVAVEA